MKHHNTHQPEDEQDDVMTDGDDGPVLPTATELHEYAVMQIAFHGFEQVLEDKFTRPGNKSWIAPPSNFSYTWH